MSNSPYETPKILAYTPDFREIDSVYLAHIRL